MSRSDSLNPHTGEPWTSSLDKLSKKSPAVMSFLMDWRNSIFFPDMPSADSPSTKVSRFSNSSITEATLSTSAI